MKKTIRGGVHPLKSKGEGKRPTENEPIRAYAAESVTIPMAMHLGAPSKPCVAVGDHVKRYQLIGEAVGGLGVNIHSSVSGEVTDISAHQQLGSRPMCVTIKNDFNDEEEALFGLGSIEAPSPEEILSAIKAAGICGMGGAAFPTHIKLSLKPTQQCDAIIVNGSECETFLTADDRLMREQPDRIIDGLFAAMRAAKVEKGVIAIEDNKPEAIKSMTEAAQKRGCISIVKLKTKYPQGGEKQLIKAVLGREVMRGKLPIDSGAVVLNVGTAAAIYDAVMYGKPLTERVTTVTGRVRRPSNLLLRVGTLLSDAIGECGGYDCEPAKIVCGGGMMGLAAPSDEISAVKATSGIVVFDGPAADLPEESACIRCGRCVEACPIGLFPYLMKLNCEKNDLEAAKSNNVMDCILCGSCTYVCPSKRWLTESFKHMKEGVAAKARREAGK